jgi:protein involved in polysaccharide export with SLBB domain
MKKIIIAGVIAVSSFSTSAFAQVKSSLTANNHTNASRATTAVETARVRETPKPTPVPQTVAANREQTANNSQATNISGRPRIAAANTSKPVASTSVNNSAAPTPVSAPTTSTAPTQLYRVGVGDILDIQIPESMSDRSTLYTIMEGGLLDYPLAGDPLTVDGLTTDAIAQKLRSSIKVLDNPEIKVKVRDYASHTAKVIGFVSLPGDKVLRREAVPLYVVLSEAMPLSDAVSVTIVRNGKELDPVNLADASGTGQIVVDGDLIKVSGQSAATAEYFYAGGEVNAPGQKAFHNGITLTQAVIASGGTGRNAGATVRVSRQGTDGRLSTVEYNLRNIQAGKVPDPQIQKNDRIEVSRNEQR